MEKKLDLILQKLEKLDSFESDLETIKSRMGGLERRMDGLDTRMDRLDTRMDRFDSRMGKFDSRMGKLEHRMGELDHINSRLNDLDHIKSQLNEHTQLFHAIRDRQEETDAKLDALSMTVNYIQGDLTSLKEGQERQDRILESLSLRSLEQETEIRELKRIK